MKTLLILLAVMLAAPCAFADSVKGYSDFVHVKGGTFLMGSPESENWRSSDR